MSAPPPTYSQQDPDDTVESVSGIEQDAVISPEPQMLINPTVDAVNFQKGFLGAEGERAAIEGELQIKGADPVQWAKV